MIAQTFLAQRYEPRQKKKRKNPGLDVHHREAHADAVLQLALGALHHASKRRPSLDPKMALGIALRGHGRQVFWRKFWGVNYLYLLGPFTINCSESTLGLDVTRVLEGCVATRP